MIPKIIHYCWFGRGAKPKLAERCIASWQKFHPEYQIIEWNEDNFNIDYSPYTRWCYDHKKYAFLSDFVRLLVVNEHGGLYFDTDVEVVRSFDNLLNNAAFFGWENNSNVASGLGFGAEANHPVLREMIRIYDNLTPNESGEFPLIVCPKINTEALLPLGLKLDGTLQDLNEVLVLPAEYMNPYDNPTGRLNKTKNTYSIHWYSKSWMSKKAILRSKLTQPFHRIFGTDCFKWLKK